MTISKDQKPRILVIDALRGFALVGIMLLHVLEHFDFFKPAEYNPEFLEPIDTIVHKVVFFIFAGKSYSIFSLLFGLSFFIQMRNQQKRGNDFRLGFAWRLLILAVFGYLHTLIYLGDILLIYAILGLPLILFYKIPTRVLLAISIILLLQVTRIYQLVYSFIEPAYTFTRNWGDWETVTKTFAEGNFFDVAKHNVTLGMKTKLDWTIASGRIYQLFGLFLLGLVIGKAQIFENLDKYKKRIKQLLVSGIALFTILQLVKYFTSQSESLNDVQTNLIADLAGQYSNLALLATWVTGFVLLFNALYKERSFYPLATYGRMSLTSYVSQGLIGAPLFYGYGLAIYQYLGNTLSLLYGLVFLFLQFLFCHYWMKNFYYGPLEWLWRCLTFRDFKLPLKRPKTLE